jgi:hypothetical protein
MKKFFEFISSNFGSISKWAAGLFKDETGTPSSKRFVGIACALTLCITMYHNSFTTTDIAPAQYLVDAVALLAFSTLGLSSVDKFVKAKKDINSATSKTEETPSTCANCGKEPCEC